MPTVALEIPQTYENITRPVALSVGRDLLSLFNIPDDATIEHLGTIGKLPTSAGVIRDGKRTPSFPFDSRVQLQSRELQQEDTEHAMTVKQVDTPSVFADDRLNVYLRPVYVRCEVQLSFNYRSASRNECYRFLDFIRRKVAQGRQQLLHEVKYTYPIPFAFLTILEEIHRLRENVAPYGETLAAWFTECFSDRLTVLSNLAGAQQVASMNERQIAIQGWFNLRDVEPQPLDDGGAWEVEFTYTFRYDRVSAMTMVYPIVVHGQLLSSRYVNQEGPYVPEDLQRVVSLSQAARDHFSSHRHFETDSEFGIRIPAHDDFVLKNDRRRIVNTFSVMFSVDDENEGYGPNIGALGPCDLSPVILNFIRQHGDVVFRYRQSIFNITWIRGLYAIEDDALTLMDDGTIQTSFSVGPRDEHRLRFGLLWDLRLLTPDAWEALKNDPDVWYRVVDYLDRYFNPPKFGALDHYQHPDRNVKGPQRPPWLWDEVTGYRPGDWWSDNDYRQRPPWWRDVFTPGDPPWVDLIDVGSDGRVTDPSIDDIVNRIPPTVDLTKVGLGRTMYTVGYSTVVAHRHKRHFQL